MPQCRNPPQGTSTFSTPAHHRVQYLQTLTPVAIPLRVHRPFPPQPKELIDFWKSLSQSPSGSIDLFHHTLVFPRNQLGNVSQSPSGSIDLFHLSHETSELRVCTIVVAIPLRVHRPFPLPFADDGSASHCRNPPQGPSTFSTRRDVVETRPLELTMSQSPSGSIDLFHHHMGRVCGSYNLLLSQSPSGSIDLFHVFEELFDAPASVLLCRNPPQGPSTFSTAMIMNSFQINRDCRNPPQGPSTFSTWQRPFPSVICRKGLSQSPSGSIDLFH